MRPKVICLDCGLVQFWKPDCRRCKRELSASPALMRGLDVALREMESRFIHGDPIVVGQPVGITTMANEPLPTAAELEMQLVQEAIRRTSGYIVRAAQMIGIGKTTIYRKLKGVQA